MKKRIELPIITEGKYDKITLTSIFDCTVITTDGFGVFNSKEKRALIRRLSERGVIVLVDSDAGGKQIRALISSMLPKEKVHNLYIPKIEGKERRKIHAGKEGTLGVEGMEREVLERVLSPFVSGEKTDTGRGIEVTKLDFFEDGLSGGPDSRARRRGLALLLDLPPDMTANALICAVRLLCSYDEYKTLVKRLDEQ